MSLAVDCLLQARADPGQQGIPGIVDSELDHQRMAPSPRDLKGA
jgi:hypothetical protein